LEYCLGEGGGLILFSVVGCSFVGRRNVSLNGGGTISPYVLFCG